MVLDHLLLRPDALLPARMQQVTIVHCTALTSASSTLLPAAEALPCARLPSAPLTHGLRQPCERRPQSEWDLQAREAQAEEGCPAARGHGGGSRRPAPGLRRAVHHLGRPVEGHLQGVRLGQEHMAATRPQC